MKITISGGQKTLKSQKMPPPELRQLPELRSSGSSDFGASGQDFGDSGENFGDSGEDL